MLCLTCQPGCFWAMGGGIAVRYWVRGWDWDGSGGVSRGFNFGGINDDKSLGFLKSIVIKHTFTKYS